MDTESTNGFDELRVKTDRSLDAERMKTDKVIDRKSQSIEDDSDEKTKENRNVADQLKRNLGKSDSEDLTQERIRADQAEKLARQTEDQVRSHERAQKRSVADALLDAERQNTDGKLHNERAQVDLLSQETTHLLTEEKSMHDQTKTALLTRDQFLAIVSHDLKDPLSTITTGASLMRIELTKQEQEMPVLSQLLGIIELGAANMDRMISDLLDVERISSDKLELQKSPIEICALLAECLELFAPVVKNKGFSMNIELCSAPIVVEIDHDRIIQVLSNLISNAIKFSGPEGLISLSAIQNQYEIEISVADNGPGIEPDKIEHLFDRFSQFNITERPCQGLGLGLFISKWIVQAHHGRIWVKSKMGQGSSFHFTLPTTQKQLSGPHGT